MVVTARTGDRETEASRGPAARPRAPAPQDWHALPRGAAPLLPLRLRGLSAEETAQVAAAAGAGALGRRALARLWEHTAGHPLYLRSLLAEAGPGALADPTRPLPVPSTLDALVRHTLDHLPADARRLTEALAVLDAPTPLALAAQLAGLPDAIAALETALAGGLVQWQPDEPTTPLRIHHPLQRDAVYHAIPPPAAVPCTPPPPPWSARTGPGTTGWPPPPALIPSWRAGLPTRPAGRPPRAATTAPPPWNYGPPTSPPPVTNTSTT